MKQLSGFLTANILMGKRQLKTDFSEFGHNFNELILFCLNFLKIHVYLHFLDRLSAVNAFYTALFVTKLIFETQKHKIKKTIRIETCF